MNRDNEKVKKIIITSLEEILNDADDASTSKRRKVSNKKRPQSASTIRNPELRYYGDDEKKFYHKLTEDQKRYVADLEKLINTMNKEDIPLRFKILLSNIDDKIKALAIKKLSYLYGMEESTGEYYKTINWIESLCKLPVGKYKQLPVTNHSSVEDIRHFITTTKGRLDEIVYGHADAKDQIIRFLAQRVSNPNSTGNVIGLCSPPGCGKTLLAKHGICKTLDLPFSFISLGGLEDSSHFCGFSPTYEGSTYGKVADLLMKAECMNPVIFFDELDKVSHTYKGDEIINLLIHMTDSTQNDRFEDKYFTDVELDLSQCLLIFSYNDETLINPILKDRMIRIRIDGYKVEDKVKISQEYLLKEICAQFGFKREDVQIHDEVLKHLINNKVESEQGVRNLKRALELIVSNLNLNVILDENNMIFPLIITEEIVNQYVKLPKNGLENMHSMYC
jgi:ATP-dependent Lon protease